MLYLANSFFSISLQIIFTEKTQVISDYRKSAAVKNIIS